jgi:hypothetical protein
MCKNGCHDIDLKNKYPSKDAKIAGLTNIDDSQKVAPAPNHRTSPQTCYSLESVSIFND